MSFPGGFYRHGRKRLIAGRPPKHLLKQLTDIEKELAQSKEKEGTEEGNQTASI